MEDLEEKLRYLTVREINEHPSKTRAEIAMEFFEMALTKESIGQLNDAADFYRKAFKLNEKVDLEYREKHVIKEAALAASAASKEPVRRLDLSKIKVHKVLESFSDSPIEEEDETLPCIGVLPNEVIEQIMMEAMSTDSASWVAMSLTCRRMAYIGFKSKALWRHLAQKLIYPQQWYRQDDDEETNNVLKPLIKMQWGFDYYKMLNERPFLKYRGVYISKVTYMREGERTGNSNSWNLPFRMITYYRYYRFYPDGTCLKLLSVLDPDKVVHSMRREAVGVPTGDDKWLQIYSGRYHLSLQGDVETDCNGSVPGYRFRDRFRIVTGGRFHRHNKLQWGEMLCEGGGNGGNLGGRHDTPGVAVVALSIENERDFFFSRVKSFN